ncbi:MAG: tetratricopeptide repeat protein [Terriglobales bacterium]
MTRARSAQLSAIFFLGTILAGCSSVGRWEFALASRLEQQGKTQAACQLYVRALQHIPAEDKQDRSQTLYRLGECLWSMGRPGEAYANYQRAVELDGSNMAARLRVGEIMLAGGALDGASEQAAAVLKSGFKDAEALALLGAASAAAGQDGVAEAAFKTVLEGDPSRINIAIALADIYNRQDRVDEARAVLKKVSGAHPGSALPLMALGRLEEQEGNATAAEQAYREAANREKTPETGLRLAQFLERAARLAEAEQVLREVDRMRPRLPTALPDFQLLAGKVPSALDSYLTAMRSAALQPRRAWDAPSPEIAGARAALAARIVEADLELARGHDDASATAVARMHLEQFRSELDPATIAILESEIAMAEDDVVEAVNQAQGAVSLAPDSAASHYVLGVAYHRSGDMAQARTAWLEAVQQDSSFAPARLALAQQALRMQDAAGAEQYVVPTVREEPANMRALTIYAEALLRQRRVAAAAVIASRAAAVDSSSAVPRILLGQIALEQGNIGEALERYQQAVLLDPHSHEAIEGLVRIYRRGKISRPMVQRLERVAEKPPRSATLMEIAGRLYAEHGWPADAERCLRRALAMDRRRSTAAVILAGMFAERGDFEAALASASRIGGKTAALLSGVSAERRRDVKGAIAQYESAVRAGDQTGVAANNLAWLYAQQGTSLDRALELAEKARAQAPENPAVLDTVGVVRLRRREYSEAISVLKNAAALASKPENSTPQLLAEIRRHLAEAYLRAGIPEQANAIDRGARAALTR